MFERRVGVDFLEVDRTTDEFIFVPEMGGIWSRPSDVEGLEFCKRLVFSPEEVRLGLVLEGLVERACTGRETADALAEDTEPERFPGVDGLDGVEGLDETEIVLEFRADVLWLDRELE